MKFVLKLETKLKFKRLKFLEERKRLRINDLVKIETRDIQRKQYQGFGVTSQAEAQWYNCNFTKFFLLPRGLSFDGNSMLSL